MEKKSTPNSYLEEESYYDSMNDSPNNENNTNSTQLNDEEQEKQKQEWEEELKKTEEEMQTLRLVLTSKQQRSQELKRLLGKTALSEIKSDLNKGITTIRSSDKYQKTTAAVKAAKEKTSSTLSEKWGILRNTNTFRNLETKMGTAYTSVKHSKSMGNMSHRLGRLTNSKSEHGDIHDSSAAGDVDPAAAASESDTTGQK